MDERSQARASLRGSHDERDLQISGPEAGRGRGRRAANLGVEDVAGNPAERKQPVLLHGPGDTQPGHPLQGALVGLVVVTQPFAFFFRELF